MLEQPVPEGLHPVGRTHIGAASGELSPVRGTFRLEQGKSMRSPPPEGQGAVETMCDELTAAPIPCPPALLLGRRERKLGVKLNLGRREGWKEVF